MRTMRMYDIWTILQLEMKRNHLAGNSLYNASPERYKVVSDLINEANKPESYEILDKIALAIEAIIDVTPIESWRPEWKNINNMLTYVQYLTNHEAVELEEGSDMLKIEAVVTFGQHFGNLEESEKELWVRNGQTYICPPNAARIANSLDW